MLCLKCGQKETLEYSEKCEDCEKKSLGFIWMALVVLILLIIFTGIKFINSIKVAILLFKVHYYYLFPLIIFIFMSSLIILGLATYVIFLFQKRKKKMPNIFIILLALNIIFYLIELALSYFIYRIQLPSSSLFELGRTLFFSILWAAYFLLSKKVKQVFIN